MLCYTSVSFLVLVMYELCGGKGWAGMGCNNVYVTYVKRWGEKCLYNLCGGVGYKHRNVLVVHYVSKKLGLENILNIFIYFKELTMKNCW